MEGSNNSINSQNSVSYQDWNQQKLKKGVPENNGLNNLIKFHKKILDLENKYYFNTFENRMPRIMDLQYFYYQKPLITFLGAYSVGKTTAFQYLTGIRYPKMDISPAKSTDSFNLISDISEHDFIQPQTLEKNQVLSCRHLPFVGFSQSLSENFSNLIRAHLVKEQSPFLKKYNIVDTPGLIHEFSSNSLEDMQFKNFWSVLIKQSDFLISFFDDRAVDLNSAMKSFIRQMINQDLQKYMIVFNKADQYKVSNLLKIYGNFMYELGKQTNRNEPPKIYLTSLWNEKLNKKMVGEEICQQIQQDQQIMLEEINSLEQNVVNIRKNQFIRRVKDLENHLKLIKFLQGQVGWFTKNKSQKYLDLMTTQNLEKFQSENWKYQFFDIQAFQQTIQSNGGLRKIPKVKQSDISKVQKVRRSVEFDELYQLSWWERIKNWFSFNKQN